MDNYDNNMDIMEMDDVVSISATTDYYGFGEGKFEYDLDWSEDWDI